MKKTIYTSVVVAGLIWGAAGAFGQRVIQPSPAYYQNTAAPAPRPVPAAPAAQPTYQQPVYHQQPVYSQPSPVAQPVPAPVAQPVYAPQPKLTLAPATMEEMYGEEYAEEDEDGIYWFWGSKWPGISFGPKIGTTGIGLDLTFGVSPYVNLRGGFNFGALGLDMSLGSVDYDMDLDMTSLPLLVDLYPGGGHFRITAGLFVQTGTEADLDGTPTGNQQIGQHTYPPEVIGTLSGKFEVSDAVSPYVGIGFGNTVGEDQLLTFTLDIGVVFQSYESSLTADGAGMTTPIDTFRKDLELEAQNLQKDLENFEIFPVVTLGLAWHF